MSDAKSGRMQVFKRNGPALDGHRALRQGVFGVKRYPLIEFIASGCPSRA